MRRRPRSFGRTRPRSGRLTDWIPGLVGPVNDVSTAETQAWSLITPGELELKQDNMTCTRIVGEIQTRVKGTDLNSAVRVFVGIAKVEFDSAGLVGLYDPAVIDDADFAGWMWRRHYDLTTQFVRPDGVAFVAAYQSASFEQAHVDIKVQRKLQGLDGIVCYTHFVNFGTSVLEEPVGLSFNLRSLVKLS